jgi:hypothetical protein
MPLHKRTAKQAWEDIARNKLAGWPSRLKGGERLSPVARPDFKSATVLTRTDRVFTIGSCFARNIEEALVDEGLDVETSKYAIPESEWPGRSNGILNKYHPYAMLNELVWALTDREFPYDSAFVETAKDQWIDLHLPGPAHPVARERVVARRREICELYKQVRHCNVVMITPGLVEAWWDKQAQYYTDRTILRGTVSQYPDRFEFHVLSFEEVHGALSEMVRLLKAHCPPDLRIFVTVSPVPLGATFTSKDVLIANTYSKSVLRAAIEQIVCEHERVEYFPSFESVTLSDRDSVFGNDFIHVKDEAVREIIGRFVVALGVREAGAAASPSHAARDKPAREAGRAVRGAVHAIRPGRVAGWAYAANSTEPVELRLLVNGQERARTAADRPRNKMRELKLHPTGKCGFLFELSEELRSGDEIRVQAVSTQRDLRNSPAVFEAGAPGAAPAATRA